MSDHHPTPFEPVDPMPTPRPRRRWWRLVLWLPVGLLSLALLAGAGVWVWAATPGSLATTLGLAQAWMRNNAQSAGMLDVQAVTGSLRTGGHIGELSWSLDGLAVQAKGVRIDWNDSLWLNALMGRGVHLSGLALDELLVNDQRPPSNEPSEPLQSLTLPLAVSAPWSVGRFELQGGTALTLGDIQGDYRYGQPLAAGAPALPEPASAASTHQLTLASLVFADGRYRAKATLGGEAPMPIVLELQGDTQAEVPGAEASAVTLQGTATVRGTLAGAQASLEVAAQVQATPGSSADATSAPALEAVARVMLWAPQPLVNANATMRSLDLAALWPQAPSTLLSGTLQAEPEGEAWRARLNLTNARSGPADQQRLPVQSLLLEVVQNGTHWSLPQLQADLGGGQLQGSAQADVHTGPDTTRISGWQSSLQMRNLQPSLLWSELAAGALDGDVTASEVAPNTSAVDIQAHIKPSATQPRPQAGHQGLEALKLEDLRLQGRWTPADHTPTQGVLELQRARIALAGATLDASGRVDTAALDITGQLEAKTPGANLRWKGRVAHAQGEGDALLQLDSAERLLAWVRGLQSLPVVGPALGDALAGLPGLTVNGNARLQAQWQGGLGAFGYPAPANTGAGAPTATTTPALPRVQVTLSVPRLQWQTESDEQPLSISELRLQAQGRLDDLQLELAGSATSAPWRAALQTSGQLRQTATAWQNGELALQNLRLRADQPEAPAAASDWTLQNTQPIRLQWRSEAQGVSLDAGSGELQVRPNLPEGGPNTAAAATPTLAWESLSWQAGTLQTKGRLSGLPLSWVDTLGPADAAGQGPLRAAGLGGDLVFDGQWDVLLPADPAQTPRLSAALQRRSGDLQLLSERSVATTVPPTSRASAGGRDTVTIPLNGAATNQPTAAGVRDARIELGLEGRALQARLRWDSAQLGEASADLSTELAAQGAPAPAADETDALARWWPASAPLRGTARARMPQVGVWSALAPPGWRVRGSLSADATIGGTRGAPEWRGNLQADDLALRSVVDGLFFSGGQLRASLEGERITIERFSLNGPRGADIGGTLVATGTAEWRQAPGGEQRQPFIHLEAVAERLRVSARADRRVTLSGNITADLAGPQLNLRGRLKADAAEIVLPDEFAPSLSSDIVVRSTHTVPVEPTLAERVKADVSVDFDLGDAFMVRGLGIETRLAGALNVRSTPTASTPRITGVVNTISGTYRAYGQQLNVETGALRFTGPYDNPALDITAVRKLPEATGQRVGVQIIGSAQAPRVRLFSDPELPDSEKLAWLVLGRPASAAGAQAFVLQQAARTLLAGNRDMAEGDLAKSFGLDEVGFQGETTAADGSTTEAALTLGKRLSDDLYLSYEHSLSSAMSTVSVFYDLSRRLTLRARAGTENAVDLIFTVQYD